MLSLKIDVIKDSLAPGHRNADADTEMKLGVQEEKRL